MAISVFCFAFKVVSGTSGYLLDFFVKQGCLSRYVSSRVPLAGWSVILNTTQAAAPVGGEGAKMFLQHAIITMRLQPGFLPPEKVIEVPQECVRLEGLELSLRLAYLRFHHCSWITNSRGTIHS